MEEDPSLMTTVDGRVMSGLRASMYIQREITRDRVKSIEASRSENRSADTEGTRNSTCGSDYKETFQDAEQNEYRA